MSGIDLGPAVCGTEGGQGVDFGGGGVRLWAGGCGGRRGVWARPCACHAGQSLYVCGRVCVRIDVGAHGSRCGSAGRPRSPRVLSVRLGLAQWGRLATLRHAFVRPAPVHC